MKITPDDVRRMMKAELDREQGRLNMGANAARLQRAVQRLTWAVILAVFVALMICWHWLAGAH